MRLSLPWYLLPITPFVVKSDKESPMLGRYRANRQIRRSRTSQCFFCGNDNLYYKDYCEECYHQFIH